MRSTVRQNRDLRRRRQQRGSITGRRFGDGRHAFPIARPAGYRISDESIANILKRYPNADIVQSDAPKEMLSGADFVYTDVWTSMGQEAEAAARRAAFAPFQVNCKLMALAAPHCRVLHCLPARRGEEITDEVMDSKAST